MTDNPQISALVEEGRVSDIYGRLTAIERARAALAGDEEIDPSGIM